MPRSAHRHAAPIAGLVLCASAPFLASAETPPKTAQAVLVPDGAIHLDGRLDEDVWELATPAEGFMQRDPEEGRLARNKTEVRFVYDGRALYVGARMSGERLQAPLGRRDSRAQVDHIFVSLDTFHDRRTAYAFGVTAAGVRLDRFHTLDSEGEADEGFDPVWQARVGVEEGGWVAEMRIPFSQVRFSPANEQVWGLNVLRFVPRGNEHSYWVLVPKTETGWSSRFGVLTGIRGISPSRRIELSPYAAGEALRSSNPDPNDPFAQSSSASGRVGLDAKMGLGPNLTLEATVNPDFGQVEADAAEGDRRLGVDGRLRRHGSVAEPRLRSGSRIRAEPIGVLGRRGLEPAVSRRQVRGAWTPRGEPGERCARGNRQGSTDEREVLPAPGRGLRPPRLGTHVARGMVGDDRGREGRWIPLARVLEGCLAVAGLRAQRHGPSPADEPASTSRPRSPGRTSGARSPSRNSRVEARTRG